MFSRFWNHRYLEVFSRFLVSYVYLFASAGLLLTGVSLYFALHLTVDSDYMAFLPENFPGVKNLKQVIKKTGGFGNFMIVLEGSTPEERRIFAEEFTRKIKDHPWVEYAEYKKDREKIEKNKFLYLSIEDLNTIHDRINNTIAMKKGSLNPFLISFSNEGEEVRFDFSDIERKYQSTSFGTPYFEDPEKKYTIAIVWPKGSMTDIDFAVAAFNDINSVLGEMLPKPGGAPLRYDPDLKAGVGGEFRTKIDEYNSLRGNILGSAATVLVVIAALLYLFYRKRGAIFYTLIPLVMGSIWSCGLAYFLVGRLNLLTVFLVAILMGLGMDYGVYFFSSYTKLRKQKNSLEETITAVLRDTGRSTFSSAITAALSFLTLVFMDFRGFREFGLLSFAGVLAIYTAFFAYSPVMWILAEKWNLIDVKKIFSPSIGMKKFPLSKFMVAGGFAIAVLGLLSIKFTSFEYDYGKLRSRHGSYARLNSKIHAVFPLSKTPAIILTDTLDETKEVVSAVMEKIPRVSTIDTVKSILDFLPANLDGKREILSRIKKLVLENMRFMSPDEKKMVEDYLPYLEPGEIRLSDLPRTILRQFVGMNGTPGYMVLVFDKVRLSDAKNAMQYYRDIGEIHTQHKTYYPAEGSLIFATTLSMMIRESLVAFLAILAGVYLVLLWDFKSAKKSLVVFLPLVMGLSTTLGIMAVAGVKLNIFNLVIFPILIGLGIDSSLHLYHQFQNYRGGQTFSEIFLHSGTSLLLSSLLNMVGFGSMLFTDHRGLQSMGLVSIIGMGSNLLICLLFFPSFLKWRAERTNTSHPL